jgi:hypothetical protein
MGGVGASFVDGCAETEAASHETTRAARTRVPEFTSFPFQNPITTPEGESGVPPQTADNPTGPKLNALPS